MDAFEAAASKRTQRRVSSPPVVHLRDEVAFDNLAANALSRFRWAERLFHHHGAERRQCRNRLGTSMRGNGKNSDFRCELSKLACDGCHADKRHHPARAVPGRFIDLDDPYEIEIGIRRKAGKM